MTCSAARGKPRLGCVHPQTQRWPGLSFPHERCVKGPPRGPAETSKHRDRVGWRDTWGQRRAAGEASYEDPSPKPASPFRTQGARYSNDVHAGPLKSTFHKYFQA